jgi:hypothetical protein
LLERIFFSASAKGQDKATKAGRYSAAIAALIAKGSRPGRWVERAEQKNTNVNYAISDKLMSEDEWDENAPIA